MVKKEWIEKGYVTEPIDSSLDLKAEIPSSWPTIIPRAIYKR